MTTPKKLTVELLASLSVLFLSCNMILGPSTSNKPLDDAFVTGERNLLGINTNYSPTSDWSEDRLFADAMKQARKWYKAGDPATPAAVDASFWPTEDAGLVVMALGRSEGTYRCRFTGQATVSGGIYGAHGTIQHVVYDNLSNSTTFEVVVTDASDGAMTLDFTGTTGGIKDLMIMRPKTRGSSESYPYGTLFTDQALALYSKFKVIRFMDYLKTNSSDLTSWSQRPLPTDAAFANRPYGGCLEYAIDLCNQVGADLWVCVPLKADEDYVTQMATLIKNRLSVQLNVYVEYSNEIWNTAPSFTQGNENHALAIAEVAAGKEPLLNAGNSTSDWTWAWRRIGLRGAQISDLFRSVWGDSEMPAPGKVAPRVRPIIASQQGYIDGPTAQMLMFIDRNLPHPVNYYFYGGGGSGYYSPTNAPDLTLNSIWLSDTMDPGFWLQTYAIKEAAVVKAFGLKRICYEGGPSFDKGSSNDALRQQAVADAQMTTNLLAHVNQAWSAADGDLFVFYAAAGDHQWGFAQDIFNLATPKLLAIDQLNSKPKTAPTVGALPPATIKGKDATLQMVYSANYPYTTGDALVMNANNYAIYLLRTTDVGSYELAFSLGTTSNDLLVYCEGVLCATIPAGANTSLPPIELVNLKPGLHTVLLRTGASGARVNSLAFTKR